MLYILWHTSETIISAYDQISLRVFMCSCFENWRYMSSCVFMCSCLRVFCFWHISQSYAKDVDHSAQKRLEAQLACDWQCVLRAFGHSGSKHLQPLLEVSRRIYSVSCSHDNATDDHEDETTGDDGAFAHEPPKKHWRLKDMRPKPAGRKQDRSGRKE